MLGEEFKEPLRNLVALREKRDQTKVAAKEAEEEYRLAEAELWDELALSPIKGGLKLDLGEPYGVVRFSPRETFFSRTLDQEKLVEYLEETDQLHEYSTPKLREQLLNELVRERLENGESMPPGVDWIARRNISISRQK